MPTYRIHGNSEEDGRPVSLDVDAPDEGRAALIAERKKVRVGKIEPTGGTPVPPPKPSTIRRVQELIDNGPMKRGPLLITHERVRPKDGEVRRQTQGAEVVVAPEDLRLSDIVYGRGGHAYLKLDYGRLFWTIAWAFVVGSFLFWVIGFVLMTILIGGVLAPVAGGAAAVRDAITEPDRPDGTDRVVP